MPALLVRITFPYGQVQHKCTGESETPARRHVDRVIHSVENDVLNVMAVHLPAFALHTECVGKYSHQYSGHLAAWIIKK